MKAMMEISMELPDVPGSLAKVTEALAEANINIETICAIGRVAPNVALVTKQVPQAKAVLDKLGINYSVSELLKMVLPDEPGVLAQFSRRLADAGGETELVFSVDDPVKARETLNIHESVPP